MKTRLLLWIPVLALCLLAVAIAAQPLQPAARYSAGAESLDSRLSSAFQEPLWGLDIQVNRPVSIPFSGERNYTLAVNPTNPNNLISSYDSVEVKSYNGYAWSTDGGHTWSNNRFNGPWARVGSEDLYPTWSGSVDFDLMGTGYYLSPAAGWQYATGVFVLTTTNGVDWSTPVPVVVSPDDEFRSYLGIAIDDHSGSPYANSLYAFWLYTSSVGQPVRGIRTQYSRARGTNWSGEIQVSDPGQEFSRSPVTAVASNGTVYVAFENTDTFSIDNEPKLYLDRSTDGGQTWGTDRLIGGTPVTAIGRPDWKRRELTLVGSAKCTYTRINHYPSMGVSPLDPNSVYVVWNDGRWEPQSLLCDEGGHNSDIAFSRSTDGGQTWSAAARINDDEQGNGIDQFQPTLAVHPDGTVGVTWYDRRYDPAHYRQDLAYTQSTDGGLTWSPNVRVSDYSSNADEMVDYKGINNSGYRKALGFGPDYAIATWLDTRHPAMQSEFYADRGDLGEPSGTPTPTFATRTATPTRTRTPTPPVSTPTRTSTVTPTATPCQVTFSDVAPSDYFYEPVRYLYCAGAISGYADGTFRPYNNTTRAQLSKIVVLAEGWTIDTTGGPHFTDVPTTDPFYAFIETAYNRRTLSGYADGTFRPGNNVTRAQLSKIIVLAEGWAIDTSGGPHFTDVPGNDPFYVFTETAYNRQIITGYADGTFRPGNSATRGQIAKIVYLAVTGP